MISRQVLVRNELGLHARAAARFVRIATRFRSRIRVSRHERTMDGKSILGILLLAATKGSRLTVIAEGEDEQDALEALVELIESGFGEATS
jgi:phosphocarrier protein HPr